MGTCGQGVQLLTVGTWGRGVPAAYSGCIGAGGGGEEVGLAAYSGYMEAGVQLLIVGA